MAGRAPEDVVTVATSEADPGYRCLLWRCAGCGGIHACQVRGAERGQARWSWNGSTTAPTLAPSVLKRPLLDGQPRCHSFVRDGIVEFLADCEHDLAGQHVAMLPAGADIWGRDPW